MHVVFLTGGSNASLSKALKHCMVSVATFAMDLYFWPESFRSFRSELAELFLPLSTDACMEDFHDLILKISCGGTGNKSGTSASGMANDSLFSPINCHASFRTSLNTYFLNVRPPKSMSSELVTNINFDKSQSKNYLYVIFSKDSWL